MVEFHVDVLDDFQRRMNGMTNFGGRLWLEGALQPGENEESQKAFGKIYKRVTQHAERPISCISAISVSPAAAVYNYQTKRDFWDQHVYGPGLELHQELKQHKRQIKREE